MGSFCSCDRQPIIKDIPKHFRKTNLRTKATIILEGIGKFKDFKEEYQFISMLSSERSSAKVRLYRNKKLKDLKFAIKTLKKDNFNSENKTHITEEISILKKIDHPNIVKYFESFEEEYYIHIVMEYIPGFNLYDVLRDRNHKKIFLSEKDIFSIIYNIIKPIKFLHGLNIIHKELKPENILFFSLDDLTNLKLIDFGFSIMDIINDNSVPTSPNFLGYEVVNGKLQKCSDVWSIGALLFFLITGDLPFKGKNKKEIFSKINKGLSEFEIKKVYFFLSENFGHKKDNFVDDENSNTQKYKLKSFYNCKRNFDSNNTNDKNYDKNNDENYDTIVNKILKTKPSNNKTSNNTYDLLNDLVLKCLVIDEKKRLDINDLINHPWINYYSSKFIFLKKFCLFFFRKFFIKKFFKIWIQQNLIQKPQI